MSTFSTIEAPEKRGPTPSATLRHLAGVVEIGILELDLESLQEPGNRWLREPIEYIKWVTNRLAGQTGEGIRSRILRTDHPIATPSVFVLVPVTIFDEKGEGQKRLVKHEIGIPVEPLALYFRRVGQPERANLLDSHSAPPILQWGHPDYRATVDAVTNKIDRGFSPYVVDNLMQSRILTLA